MEVKNKEEDLGKYNFICFAIALVIIVAIVAFLISSFDRTNKSYRRELSTSDISKLALDKYNSINNVRNLENNELIFFNDMFIDVNTISNEDVLYIAYSLLSKEDKKISGTIDDKCYLSNEVSIDNYPSDCYLEVINKSLLEEQIRNYFSSSINISYNTFNISSNQTCYLIENDYKCYLNRNSASVNDYYHIGEYDSYELENDYLVVYSYLLTVRKKDDAIYKEGIYSDSKATKYIDNLVFFQTNTNRTFDSDTSKKLIDNYKDKISKYKSIFVKENNNYVWLSTQLVM